MDDTGLDEISEKFFVNNYSNINLRISIIQEKYIESRIKWVWRLPLIRNFTATKVVLMFSAPSIEILEIADEYKPFIEFNQKVMLVGKSLFWAHLLMKRRK